MSKGPRKPLGELESAVLGALWDSRGKLSVREVLECLERSGSELAYTTVLTVLDRMHDKGLVLREKDGKAFTYWPQLSREAYLGAQAARMLTEVTVPVQRDVLMAFLDSAEHADPAVLDELSALIKARRRRGKP
ncbi:MAG TPA: BlaI/MecI/CopY family transcriptional regulator [Polyangiaceae bacterium]|nr:BlaI/MecI/CopY family transcriptional regulator [Polyangiaceae bacterium]